jgi:hypothetical protein
MQLFNGADVSDDTSKEGGMTLLSSFIFCETTLKQINDLPDDLRLKFYEAVTNYGIYNIEPHFTGLENTIWISMKDIIDTTKARRKSKQKAGKLGGDAKAKNQQAKQVVADDSNPYQALPNGNGNANDNANTNTNEKSVCEENKKHFIKLWQSNPDVFDPLARLKKPDDFNAWWEKNAITIEMIDLAVKNFVEGIRDGSISTQYIPANPDTFILNGGIRRYQTPYNSQSPPEPVNDWKDFGIKG